MSLEYATDDTLIENLQFQINILEGKVIDKTLKKLWRIKNEQFGNKKG